jgi:hypothetical protein
MNCETASGLISRENAPEATMLRMVPPGLNDSNCIVNT